MEVRPSVAKELLARAHAPAAVDQIFTDAILRRPLRLRPSTPPPPSADARAARTAARTARTRRRPRPAPLSARARRRMGLYDTPAPRSRQRRGNARARFEPLQALWHGYARAVLGPDLYAAVGGGGAPEAAAKLAAAELHGAAVRVVRSRCVGRVGLCGIVVRDSRAALEIATADRGVRLVPKEGTVFSVCVQPAASSAEHPSTAPSTAPSAAATPALDSADFVFELHGDQFRIRSADRANKKFKHHFLDDL